MNDTVGGNSGWKARRSWFFQREGLYNRPLHRTKELWGKLLHPLVNTDVPVPPGVPIHLRLDVAPDAFVLLQVNDT